MDDNKISPLVSPIHGGDLTVVSKNIYYDELTGDSYTAKDGGIAQIESQEEYDQIASMNSEGLDKTA